MDDDCMWLEIKTHTKSLLLGHFYRSPSQSPVLRDQFFSNMDNMLENILRVKTDLVVFGGDFNARSKFWWNADINTAEGNILYDLSVKHSLSQLVNEPTRITATSNTCLDLFFCNNPGYILNTEVHELISVSDHP
jgi:hypothetical protein